MTYRRIALLIALFGVLPLASCTNAPPAIEPIEITTPSGVAM